MCKPSKPKPVEIDAPDYLRNPFLDQARNPAAAARALRAGRSSLRIPRTGMSSPNPGSTSGASRSPGTVLGAQGNGRAPASGLSAPVRVTGISI